MIGKVYASIGLQIFAAVITMIQIFMFYGTNKKKNILSSIFIMCTIIVLFSITFEISTTISIIYNYSVSYINVSSRLFMIFMFYTFFTYSSYIGYLYLVKKENYENIKYKKNLYIYWGTTFVASIIISMLFPVEYGCNVEFNACYLRGSFIDVSRLLIFIASIVHSTILFICVRKKIVKINMLLPISGILSYALFYWYFEHFNIDGGFSTLFQAISTTMLFLTFENQDSKLIEDQKTIDHKIEIANTEKRTFLMNLSHFIRSKYAIMMSIAKINFDANESNNNFISSDITEMENNNNKLMELSNVIIDLSNITNESYNVNINKYNVNQINTYVNDIYKNYNLKMEVKQYCENIECTNDLNIIQKVIKCLFRTLSILQTYGMVYFNIKNSQDKIQFEIFFDNPSINSNILDINEDIIFDKNILSKELELNVLIVKKLLQLINSNLEFRKDNNNCIYSFEIKQNEDLNASININETVTGGDK